MKVFKQVAILVISLATTQIIRGQSYTTIGTGNQEI
jgi:hypothetical protein